MTRGSETRDGGEPGDALQQQAGEVFLRFLAQRRADSARDFEDFLAEQPPTLQPGVRGLHDNWCALQPVLGDLDGVDVSQLYSNLGDSLESTHSFDGIETGSLRDLPEGTAPGTPRGLFDRIGDADEFGARYKVDRQVAMGGMGCIYRVWDRRLRRYLAMKVMRPAEQGELPAWALERFHSEALVTAQLDHPGILPVHDMGVDDEGRVFFTMKYVKGRRSLRLILDMVARRQDGWTVNRVVGSILRVCEAVAYAHSKHVLHRDIKPANIMVGQYGETYLLDWGLARRLDQPDPPVRDGPALAGLLPEAARQALPVTGPDAMVAVESWLFSRDGKIVGTPPYMSPEQARGEIDRVSERSDVYSLGALLYHLLSGRPPFVEADESPFPIVVLVRVQRDAPTPLRELAPDAPPGLVAICEKAMARDPSARYASVSEMARDLEDYLEDISADREEARRQAQRATTINEFLLRMLTSADPRQAQGRELTVMEVLAEFSRRIEDGLAGVPLDEAQLRRTIGNVYKELGRHGQAREHLERALAVFEELLGFDHPETLASATDLAVLRGLLGDLPGAERLLDEVREVQTEKLGARHLDTLRTLVVLAEVQRRARGRLAEAEALLRRVIDGRAEKLGSGHLDTLTAMNRLAMVKWDEDHADAEAESLLRRVVSGLREAVGERHPETLIAMNDLAGILQQTDRLAEAEGLLRRTLAGQRVVLGRDHSETLTSEANLGWLLNRRGELEEAERILQDAVARQSEVMGADNPDLLVFRNNLAKTIQQRGRPREALVLFEQVVAAADRAPSPPNWHNARFHHNLGCCLAELGELERAQRELRGARAVLVDVLGERHQFAVEAAEELAELERRRQSSDPPG